MALACSGVEGRRRNRTSCFCEKSFQPGTSTPGLLLLGIIVDKEGCQRYPAARKLFILADGGGSNGPRCRAWRKAIQDTICTPLGLIVTVSHYPPGASKWNPIAHRLFSQISKNWAGEPLTDIDKILKFIRTTKTESGLTVSAYLIPENYDTGIKISDGGNASTQPRSPRNARPLELNRTPHSECELVLGHRLSQRGVVHFSDPDIAPLRGALWARLGRISRG